MIVWLNGTFGAGKTTTSGQLLRLLPESRVFDSEMVGFMLRHVMAPEPVSDFQHWPPWRPLVVETAVQVLRHVGGTLVVPQTVLVEAYWREIHDGLTAAGVPVRHFVLDADRETLTSRIESHQAGSEVRQWRLDHLTPYEQARPWLHQAGEVVATVGRTPAEVAREIADRVVGPAGPGADLVAGRPGR